jgi:hypothetical protein
VSYCHARRFLLASDFQRLGALWHIEKHMMFREFPIALVDHHHGRTA